MPDLFVFLKAMRAKMNDSNSINLLSKTITELELNDAELYRFKNQMNLQVGMQLDEFVKKAITGLQATGLQQSEGYNQCLIDLSNRAKQLIKYGTEMEDLAIYADRKNNIRCKVVKIEPTPSGTRIHYKFGEGPVRCTGRNNFKKQYYNVAGMVV